MHHHDQRTTDSVNATSGTKNIVKRKSENEAGTRAQNKQYKNKVAPKRKVPRVFPESAQVGSFVCFFFGSDFSAVQRRPEGSRHLVLGPAKSGPRPLHYEAPRRHQSAHVLRLGSQRSIPHIRSVSSTVSRPFPDVLCSVFFSSFPTGSEKSIGKSGTTANIVQ